MVRKALAFLATAALFPAGVAQASWYEGSSKHFLVYADDSPEHVKAMTEGLERFDKAVRVALKLREPEVSPHARVTVYVLPSVDAVQKMAGRSGVAGYYQNQLSSGPVAFVPAEDNNGSVTALTPRMILQHEYAHHVMFSSWGDVVFPPWFSEGFAELFATARIRPDGSVVIGAIPAYRTYGIDQMNVVPIERLMKGGPNYKNGLEAQVFYGRAWLLTHYMIFDPERAKQLSAYIEAVNNGKSPDAAASALGVSSGTDIKLNNYGKQKTLPSALLDASKLPIPPVTTRQLTAGEAAIMSAQMRSQNGVDAKRAQEVVADARAVAASYPNDAGVQNELAEAEYDAGNYEASQAAADRVLAIDPNSMHGMVYKGMSMLAIAKKANNTDPAVWQAARRWYLKANRTDPLYSQPIQLLYESYETAKEQPSEGVKKGLVYAYQLAPHSLTLRFEAAHVLLEQNNAKAARVALEPIAFSERGGKIAEVAQKSIDLIDKGDLPGALAALKLPDPEEKKPDEPAKKS